MSVDFRKLKSFVKIVDAGSVSRAASILRTAQPALSQQVRDLEAELGIRLFDRTTRRVELTEGGAEFRNIAAKVMEKLGIAGELKARTKFVNGRPVAEAVASGEIEVGIQQINVLLPVPGADYVGPLPGELQDYVLFSLGVMAVSKQQDVAKAFQAFAIAPENAALLRKSSMEPWRGR